MLSLCRTLLWIKNNTVTNSNRGINWMSSISGIFRFLLWSSINRDRFPYNGNFVFGFHSHLVNRNRDHGAYEHTCMYASSSRRFMCSFLRQWEGGWKPHLVPSIYLVMIYEECWWVSPGFRGSGRRGCPKTLSTLVKLAEISIQGFRHGPLGHPQAGVNYSQRPHLVLKVTDF